MRDLKFRAWDSKRKVMIVEGFHVIGEVTMFNMIEQSICENKEAGEDTLSRMNDIIITQFTGRKDSNGLGIYEGDIVKRLDKSEWEVVFEKEAFHLKGAKPLYEVNGTLEVVGNIFQPLKK